MTRKDTFRLVSIAAAAGTSALAVPACSETGKEPEKRPNIVLIVADDLGLGDVSLYSGSAPEGLDSKAYTEVLIGNDTIKGRETLILEAQGRLALKEGDYVLIPAYSGSNENPTTIDFGLNPEVTLWNLANDRSQKEDISKENKGLTDKMMRSFKDIVGKAYVSDFKAEGLK